MCKTFLRRACERKQKRNEPYHQSMINKHMRMLCYFIFSPLRTLYSPCVLSGWDVMGYWKKLRMAGETSGSFSSMNLRFFFSHNLQTTCYMVLEFKGKYFNDRKELYKSTQPLKNNPRGTELYMPQTHHEWANTSFHILVKKETHLIMSNCKVKLCVIFRIYTIHSSKHF